MHGRKGAGRLVAALVLKTRARQRGVDHEGQLGQQRTQLLLSEGPPPRIHEGADAEAHGGRGARQTASLGVAVVVSRVGALHVGMAVIVGWIGALRLGMAVVMGCLRLRVAVIVGWIGALRLGMAVIVGWIGALSVRVAVLVGRLRLRVAVVVS